MNRPQVVPYPFLAGTYSVLALAAGNGGEFMRVEDVARPLAIALGLAALAWIASRAVTADVHRRAIVSFVAIIVLTTYGYWQTFFDAVSRFRPLAANEVLLLVSGVAIGLTAFAATRPGSGRKDLTSFLNTAMTLLVATSLGTIAWNLLRPRPELVLKPLAAAATSNASDLPHIFLIVLDKYTGSRSLRANYGYDNAPFERFLEGRGFRVPHAARANYVNTFLALAAMLNWEYVQESVPLPGPDEGRWDLLYPLIENNRTTGALKSVGYRFVFMPTVYGATARNRQADVQLPDPKALTREFEVVWLRTTALNGLMDLWCARWRCPQAFLPWASETARSLDWKFDQLPALATSKSPVFVLAHLTVPHEPYVYGPECSHEPAYWPRRDDGRDAPRVRRAYVAQVQCVNRKLERLVLDLQRLSARRIVIALQSDHGHGRLGLYIPPLRDTPASNVAERLDIFAAYHLPGAPADVVSDSIGPVNFMRALMRHYLGLPLPPLAEASYWSAARRPYDLTPVR
jgi:hypothetical protein